MKILNILIAAAAILITVSCRKEDPTPQDPVTPDYNTVAFVTSLKSVTTPTIGGTSVSGSIDWGDGTTDTWKESASKTYTKESQHTVTIKVENATSVTFGSLEGIVSLDFSQF